MSIYIVKVTEDGQEFEYEYGILNHAREQFNNEKNACLIEYKSGNYFLMEVK